MDNYNRLLLLLLLLLLLSIAMVNSLILCFLNKLWFQKARYETDFFFFLTECLVKAVKKCFMKNLSIWLVLIKFAV